MEIILYDAKWKTAAQTPPPSSKQKLKSRPSQFLGFGLILSSFLLLAINLAPILKEEIAYRLKKKSPQKNDLVYAKQLAQTAIEEEKEKERREETAKEAEKYGVSADFSIVIPKINAVSKIIPNVNPADEEEYKRLLKEGVAHSLGTKFPGEGGRIYLFSHSTNSPINISRYNAVFYLLKELTAGDEIIVFYGGKKFIYKIVDRLITSADDTKWLTQEVQEEILILQTCWPPGTSLKRLLVIAKPI